MRCEECGNNEWETVLGYVRKEEEEWIHLFQCKNCKRVVACDDDCYYSDEVI